MLAKSLVEKINRLLSEGSLSQRQIAAKLRVSRGTVSAIAGGRRGLYGREVGDDEELSLQPTSPPERCPCCGYRVYLPCLICSSRDFQRRQAVLHGAEATLEQSASPPVKPQGQGRGEAPKHGDIALMRSSVCFYKSPISRFPIRKSFSPVVPLLTLIPSVACTPA